MGILYIRYPRNPCWNTHIYYCVLLSRMYFLLFKGWRWAFFISGIPGILVGILLFITVQEPERTTGKATEEKSETIVKEKPLQRLVKILKPFLAPSLILAVLAGSVRNAGKTFFVLLSH